MLKSADCAVLNTLVVMMTMSSDVENSKN